MKIKLAGRGSIAGVVVPSDKRRRMVYSFEVFDRSTNFRNWQRPRSWVHIPLAVFQEVFNGRIRRSLVLWIARAEAGVSPMAQVHQPAAVAIDQRGQRLSIG